MELLYFTFNGISSENYGMFIQNAGEDLVFPSQPNFEGLKTAPKFQNISYNLGTNYTDRSFRFNCWVHDSTQTELKSLLQWLDVGKEGKLILDINPNFYYNVKISSISDFKHFLNTENSMNLEFTIAFDTIGDFAAISQQEYDQTTVVNNLVYNWGTLPMYLNIAATPPFSVSFNGVEHYKYEPASVDGGDIPFTINTRNGFCLTAKGDLAERVYDDDFINKNAFELEGVKQIALQTDEFTGKVNMSDVSHLSANVLFFVDDDEVKLNKTDLSNQVFDVDSLIVVHYVEPVLVETTGPSTEYTYRYRNKY